MLKKTFLFIATVNLFVCCQEKPLETFDILITNASIINVNTGDISQNNLIGITNDTIRLVTNTAQENQFEATTKLDAENKFVMPGLWDMHVHFRGGDTLSTENKNLLPLFLAYGITTVRDAGGDITTSVLNWRKAISQGQMVGPTIFTSGPKLDGKNPAWEGSIGVETEESIKKALDSLESLGVDYVKMYDGSLTKQAYYSIIKEAKKRGLKTTGHMPFDANIPEAVSYGLNGTEHMYYVLKSCSPLEDSINEFSRANIETMFDTFDSYIAKKTFEALAKQDFFITPTLAILDVLSDLSQRDHSQDTLLPYIENGIVKTYQLRVKNAKRTDSLGLRNLNKDEFLLTKQNITIMQDAGINILVGSDSGPFNSYCYPGESLIIELELLVASGLTPQQALKASVVNGPHFFDLDAYYGSVDAGKVADIIILNKNPLEDIKNITTLSTLIKSSNVFTKKDLLTMLETLKN